MGYGAGRLYLRPNGKIWQMEYWVDGKQIRESTDKTDKDAAQRMLNARIADKDRGREIVEVTAKSTFEQMAAAYAIDFAQQGNVSWPRTALAIAHLSEVFAKDRAHKITQARVREYVAARLAGDPAKKIKGARPATVRKELAALGRMMRLAGITPPKFPTLDLDNARVGFFEHDQYLAVRAELPDFMRGMIDFFYLTGWRKNEVIGLEWRRVDFKAGTVSLEKRTTKNKKARLFPFCDFPDLKAVLVRQRERTQAVERELGRIVPHVFHWPATVRKDQAGQPILYPYGLFREACKRARVPGRLIHDFRRTAVRNLVRNGVPDKWAMELVGHKTMDVFFRYDIVTETDLRDATRRMAAAGSVLPAEGAAS